MASIQYSVFLVAAFLLSPTYLGVPQSGIGARAFGFLPLGPELPIEQELMENSTGKHFVLVHGSNFGAWSWYKVIPLLKAAGRNVTALDLAGNGADPRRLDEVTSFSEYVQPLTDFMASLPDGEKVILVGHGYGGFCISLAMENFPGKVSVAVSLTAFMPNYVNPPVTQLKEYISILPPDSFSDSVIANDSKNEPASILFGPEFIATRAYEFSSTKDQELAKTLVRPTGLFMDDLSKSLLTQNNYGSVTRVFIISGHDQVLIVDFQKVLILDSFPVEVKFTTIDESDHLVMISKPQELYLSLQEIADTYN